MQRVAGSGAGMGGGGWGWVGARAEAGTGVLADSGETKNCADVQRVRSV